MGFTRVRGTRDFLPPESLRREKFLETIRKTYEEFGFVPWDTPALESADFLTSKGGEEIREEIYVFRDKGGREIGLRFDLTLPTARVLAENRDLALPIKRYMIGKVWRYDRPQAGRYREFTQADVDIFGSRELVADAEVVACVYTALERSGVGITVQVNDRRLLDAISDYLGIPADMRPVFYRALDKWYKVGEEGVRKELGSLEKYLDGFLEFNTEISEIPEPTGDISGVKKDLLRLGELLDSFGVPWTYNPFIVRGLDYYTGPVFESFADRPLSLASGGRYDELIGLLGGRDIPATGMSIGVDRVLDLYGEAMETPGEADVYVAVIPGYERGAISVSRELRSRGIRVFMDVSGRKLSKQLADAERRGIRYVVIVGREVEEGRVILKDMEQMTQKEVEISSITDLLKSLMSS